MNYKQSPINDLGEAGNNYLLISVLWIIYYSMFFIMKPWII